MKKLSEQNLKGAVIILVITVTVLLGTAFLLVKVIHMRNTCVREEYDIIASRIKDVTEAAVDKPIVASLTMASDVFLKELLKNEKEYSQEQMVSRLSGYLTGIKETMEAQTAFVVSEDSRKYYTYEGLNKVIDPENDEHDIWYAIFANSRKDYDLDVDTDQMNGNTWTVFVNARIEDEYGRLLGVCGMGFTLDALQEILKSVETEYQIKVSFVNPDGLVQVDTDMVNIEAASLYDLRYGKEKDGYAYKNEEGEYVIMRYVDSLNWYLLLHGSGLVVEPQEIVKIILCGIIIIAIHVFAVCLIMRREQQIK